MKKVLLFIPLLVIISGGLYWWRSLPMHQKPHGIILISIDTLRADHLGVYGYHRDTSPAIDAFAREGVVFDRAVAHSPLTLPSHMSIMTSLYPFSHGILSNSNRLADEHVTLAEILRESGYKTAGFADGAFMRGNYGFHQGFDIYDGDKRIGIANILPKVRTWLEENKTDPFFLFIHCYDVHDPYNPPPPHNTIFHDFAYDGTFVPNTENMKAAAWKGLEVTAQDLRHIMALYDGGIRYTDARIGEFIAYLKEEGLKETSLVIITSDHGEEFREQGSFLHWQLYFRPNLHVPLIMHIPGALKKMVRVRDQVQSIDILPTILDIAGLPPHADAQGSSLVTLMKRNRSMPDRIWGRIVDVISRDDNRPIALAATKFRRRQSSIIRDGYQLIYTMSSGSAELFDLRNDPLAQNNIAGNNLTLVKQLLSELNRIQEGLPQYNTSTFILDAETRQQLEALGYIDD